MGLLYYNLEKIYIVSVQRNVQPLGTSQGIQNKIMYHLNIILSVSIMILMVWSHYCIVKTINPKSNL